MLKFFKNSDEKNSDMYEDEYDFKEFLNFLASNKKVIFLFVFLGLIFGVIFSLNKKEYYKSTIPIELEIQNTSQLIEMKENIVKNTRYHFYFLIYSDVYYQIIIKKLCEINSEFKNNFIKNRGILSELNNNTNKLVDIGMDESLTFLTLNTMLPFKISDINVYHDMIVSINYASKFFNEAQLKNYSQSYNANYLEIKNLENKNKKIVHDMDAKFLYLNTLYYKTFNLINKKNASINELNKYGIDQINGDLSSNDYEFKLKLLDKNIFLLKNNIYSNIAILSARNEIKNLDYTNYLKTISEITAEYDLLKIEASSNFKAINNIYTEINSYFLNPKNFYLPEIKLSNNPELKNLTTLLVPINYYIYIGSGAVCGFLIGVFLSFLHSMFRLRKNF